MVSCLEKHFNFQLKMKGRFDTPCLIFILEQNKIFIMPGKCHFQISWIADPGLTLWLKPVNIDYGPNSTVNKNISIKNLLAFSELMVNSVITWAYLDQMLMFIYIRALGYDVHHFKLLKRRTLKNSPMDK